MVEHRQEFQRELEAIEAKVTGLFAMVAEDLPGATDALLPAPCGIAVSPVLTSGFLLPLGTSVDRTRR